MIITQFLRIILGLVGEFISPHVCTQGSAHGRTDGLASYASSAEEGDISNYVPWPLPLGGCQLDSVPQKKRIRRGKKNNKDEKPPCCPEAAAASLWAAQRGRKECTAQRSARHNCLADLVHRHGRSPSSPSSSQLLVAGCEVVRVW